MNRDINTLAVTLRAELEFLADNIPDAEIEILRFSDERLRYELHIQPDNNTAMLAIDPTEPIQPCPMLEYSSRCTDIVAGQSAYCVGGNEVAVRFYECGITESSQRMTMTWITDGYWYIWANAIAKPLDGNNGITIG